ncbi:MAG: glutathione binding-like protein [Rhodopila sp.]
MAPKAPLSSQIPDESYANIGFTSSVKFARQPANNTFVAGERFTIADATTLAAVDFAGWSDVKIPASCRHLQRWYDQVNQRPSAKA